MLLGTKKTFYDYIIEALLEKSLSVAEIQDFLNSKHVKSTVQGIYKTLRELISEDVVVKQKKSYSVNNVWREKLGNLVSQKTPFQLSAGEQTTYRFKKLDHLDAFWKHTLADIEHEVGQFPVFHFTPHQFWFLVPGREESEREYYRNLETNHVHVYTVIGHQTPFDKTARESLKTDLHRIHLDSNTPFNRRDHISAIGPYVVTTRVSGTLAKTTDHLYKTANDQKNLDQEIRNIFKHPGTMTIIVEHNEPKAKKIRKRLSTDFHIQRELSEQFDLF